MFFYRIKKLKMNVHKQTNKVTDYEPTHFKNEKINAISNPTVESSYVELEEINAISTHYETLH